MKKNLFISFTFLVNAICLFTSCYVPITDPYVIPESRQKENIYYVPSGTNTQLLSEKNDFAFNVNRSANEEFSGVELQASYLPAKHIGIVASYSSAGSGSDDKLKYHGFDGGVGYVTHLSKEWHFETYAGIGVGKIDNTHATGNSQVNFTRYFIQPAFAVSNIKKTVQLGFLSRFTGVNIKIDTAFDNARELYSTTQAQSIYNNPFRVMWEPGIELQFGWKNFLFHTSYMLSANLSTPELHKANSNFSIGGSLRFNTSTKK